MPKPEGGYGNHGDQPWMHNPPQQLQAPVVSHYNPPAQSWQRNGNGHSVALPPVVPTTNWHSQWLDQCGHEGHGNGGCQPPANSQVFVDRGHDGRPVIINQFNGPVEGYFTNIRTHEIRHYSDIRNGTPWGFPGDLEAGDWQWSAGCNGTFYGGGAFRIGAGGEYLPFDRPSYAIQFNFDGFIPEIADAGDWYVVPGDNGTDFVYANGCEYAIAPDQLPPPELPEDYGNQPYVLQPTGYTQSPVTQAVQPGPPPQFVPFHTGRSPLPYAIVGMVVIALAGGAGVYMARRGKGHGFTAA